MDEFVRALDIFQISKPRPRMGFSTLNTEELWREECELRWETELTQQFFEQAVATNLFNKFIKFAKLFETGEFLKNAKTVIDADTIEALGLLRAHFHAPKLSSIKKFEGVRKEGMSALDYYEKHYADVKEAINGRLLSQHDRKLYLGMNDELRRDGRSISEIIPSYESTLDARRKAAATLLGVDLSEHPEDQLYNFFTSIRRR